MYRLKFWQSQGGDRPVRNWLLSLTFEEKKKVDKLLKLLEAFGTSLPSPNGKYLGDGLFEARDDSKGPGFRVYCHRTEEVILVLLVGGDKSSQKRDIETAKKRMQELTKQEHGK
jgi:putative addiction module killer protein